MVTVLIGSSEKISTVLGHSKVNLPITIFPLYQCISALDQHQKKECIYACERTVNCFLSYSDRGMPLILQHMAQNQSLLLLHFHRVRMLILDHILYINLIKWIRNKFWVLVNSGLFFICFFFFSLIVDLKPQVNNMYRESILKSFTRLKARRKVINSCKYAVLKLPLKIKAFVAKWKAYYAISLS